MLQRYKTKLPTSITELNNAPITLMCTGLET